MCITELPNLLYYTHLPLIMLSIFFGVFIYLQNKNGILNRLLLAISFVFAFYSTIDFLMWFPWSFTVYLFFQRLLILIILLLPLLIYFAYNLIKANISKLTHFLIWIPFIPILVINFSKYSNLIYSISYEDSNCVVGENFLYYYIYLLGIIYFLWFVGILLFRFFSKNIDEMTKKKIRVVIYATTVLIFWILIIAKLQSFVGENIMLLAPFGMIVFINILIYAISKYRLFNIKLLFAQAIVIGLIFFWATELFLVENATNRILILIKLLISIGLGYILIKSVKLEIQQRKALEIANREISQRKEELQKISTALAITNDKLKHLDRVKSDFFNRASHDLRTPITGIIGYISMLDEGSYGTVTEQQKIIFQKIISITTNMRSLIEDFLIAAKLDAEGMQYNFEKTKVDKICEHIIETLYPKSKEKKLYLDFKKPETELPELIIDASRIRESISNLVDNAIKYTEKGGITVTLECAKSSNYKPLINNESNEEKFESIIGPVIRITISDTGIGIPKNEIKFIFSRFSRGKGIAKTKTSGIGLGLYICKGIIKDNGGIVWAESDGKDKGSKFIVELPINTPNEILQKIKDKGEAGGN